MGIPHPMFSLPIRRGQGAFKSLYAQSLAVRVAGRDRVAVLAVRPRVMAEPPHLVPAWVFGYTFSRPYFNGGYLCCGLLAVLSSRKAYARLGPRARPPSVFVSRFRECCWQACSSCPVLATWQGHVCAGRLAAAHGLVVQLPALTCLLIGSEIRLPFEACRALHG